MGETYAEQQARMERNGLMRVLGPTRVNWEDPADAPSCDSWCEEPCWMNCRMPESA